MGWPKGVPRPQSMRAKMSAASKKAWSDPAVRAKMSAGLERRRNRHCFHCESRNTYSLIPLEGIDGEFECRDQGRCEDRIMRKQSVA